MTYDNVKHFYKVYISNYIRHGQSNMWGLIFRIHLHFYLMCNKSMSKIIKSMRKIIRSMREDLKSMRKIIKSMRKIIKSMRKVFQVNAQSFSSQCAKSTRENLKSMCKVIAHSLTIFQFLPVAYLGTINWLTGRTDWTGLTELTDGSG